MEQKENERIIEKKTVFHTKEWILAGGMVLMAYFYLSVIRYPTELARLIWWQAQLNTEYLRVGLAWMVFTIMFLGAGMWYVTTLYAEDRDVAQRGLKWVTGLKRLPRDSWLYFGLTVAAGIWFPFYMKGDQDVLFYMLLFLHGVAVYWLMTVSGSIRGKELDERGVGDLFRGFFVLPFWGYPQFFRESGQLARFAFRTKRGKDSKMGQVLLGLLISVPVLGIAISILRGADIYFDRLAGSLLQGVNETLERMELMSMVFTFIWTIVLAGYFFGLFYRATHKKEMGCDENQTSISMELSVEMPVEPARWQIPQVMLTGFLIPIILLYLLFFAVRILGVTGAMDQIATGELWISTYAREGFFELCWIAAINFVIYTVSRWYSPRAGKGIRCLISGLGVETMAFVGFAFSKMWYYIQAYGSFTFKRAMCCWLLLTLLVTFGLMTLELWKKEVKGIKWGVWFGSVTFLMMAYSNMPVWAP